MRHLRFNLQSKLNLRGLIGRPEDPATPNRPVGPPVRHQFLVILGRQYLEVINL